MNDENEQIESGLREGESLAEKAKRLADAYDSAKLYELGEYRVIRTVGEMAEAGAYFCAIREKERRNFKKFFDGKRLEYKHALYFIHCAEIVDQHPKFADLKSSRAIHELLSFTKPNQAQIAERLADVPMDGIQRVARAEIDRLHRETTKRKPQSDGRGRPDPLDQLRRWCKSINAIAKKIYGLHELDEVEDGDRVKWAEYLKNAYDQADYHIRDPEHRSKYFGDIPPTNFKEIFGAEEQGPIVEEYDTSHLKERVIHLK